MTGTTEHDDGPRSIDGHLHRPDHDLYRACGALEEIATVWRRAHQGQPGRPLDLPVRLASTTRELAQMVSALVDAGPGPSPGRVIPVTERLAALKKEIAAAQAMTGGAGLPPARDAELWELAGTAVDRADHRLLNLVRELGG